MEPVKMKNNNQINVKHKDRMSGYNNFQNMNRSINDLGQNHKLVFNDMMPMDTTHIYDGDENASDAVKKI